MQNFSNSHNLVFDMDSQEIDSTPVDYNNTLDSNEVTQLNCGKVSHEVHFWIVILGFFSIVGGDSGISGIRVHTDYSVP